MFSDVNFVHNLLGQSRGHKQATRQVLIAASWRHIMPWWKLACIVVPA